MNKPSITITHILLLTCIFVSLMGFGSMLYLVTQFAPPTPVVVEKIADQAMSIPKLGSVQTQPVNNVASTQVVDKPLPVTTTTISTLPPKKTEETLHRKTEPTLIEPDILGDTNNDGKLSGAEQFLLYNPDDMSGAYYSSTWWAEKCILNMDTYAGDSLARQHGCLTPRDIVDMDKRYHPPSKDTRIETELIFASDSPYVKGRISSKNAAAMKRIEDSQVLLKDIPRDNLGRAYDRAVSMREYENRALSEHPEYAIALKLETIKAGYQAEQ